MEASEIHAAERDVMALARVYECITIIDDGIAGEIGEMCTWVCTGHSTRYFRQCGVVR